MIRRRRDAGQPAEANRGPPPPAPLAGPARAGGTWALESAVATGGRGVGEHDTSSTPKTGRPAHDSGAGDAGGGHRLNVLLVGGGGREHALAAAIASSPRLGTLYASHTSNPGIASLATPTGLPTEVFAGGQGAYRAQFFCRDHGVDLVVVGPEAPLAAGLADTLRAGGVAVFGPGADGARLEADKAWAKDLMRQAAVPTAEARVFTSSVPAVEYALSRGEPPVVKASGLAAGKGVVVPATHKEAADAIRAMLDGRSLGEAGGRVLVEERLAGPEVSVFALTDGRGVYLLDACQDHKRLRDGGLGPNTGGMGAFCPSPLVDDALLDRVQREILLPIIDSLKRLGVDYRGVLYLGLMLTHAGPKVLEFNVRFGDPEAQALLPRIRSDPLTMLHATACGEVESLELDFHPGATVCVVLASEGYPEKPVVGQPITGVERAEVVQGVTVYHAGTAIDRDGRLVTAGGRVLGVTARGASLAEARERAYESAAMIHFPGVHYRRDIATTADAPLSRA